MLFVLSHFQVKQILAASGLTTCTTSLDLGLTQTEVELTDLGMRTSDGSCITWKKIEKLAKSERKCIACYDGEWKDVRALSETTGWVRSLCPTSGAPTTLVSGFPMHRIKNTDPWEDTKAKLSALGKIRGSVLDTATGLGYTAIQAAEAAAEVVTVELDPTAIEIARMNPWSARLFDNEKITQVIGDVAEEIKQFPLDRFNAIIHDPPTIQYAGDLYSREFYIELRRVLKNRGQMFHYIGAPESKQGSKLTEGVIRRLKQAGFRTVKRHPEAFGVVAS